MKIGLIARADNTGLGAQTWELYRHLKPHRTYVIDLTEINQQMGKVTHNFMDRYPDGIMVQGFPNAEQCRAMLEDIDVLFTVEIPYNYDLFAMAREAGVRTVLQYNYEFLDYLASPDLPLPDVLLAPSKWHYEDVEKKFGSRCRVEYLEVPVATDRIQYRRRTSARHFFHVAGHRTYMDRNGTGTVLAALQYIDSPVSVTLHSQFALSELTGSGITVPKHVKLEVIPTELLNYWDIYNNPNYDVMLLPRRYGGLSLQLNEALAAGKPVLMTDAEPQCHILPDEVLVPVEGKEEIMTRTRIECWNPDPVALAAAIDELYNDGELVEDLSIAAGSYGREISWRAMAPKYIKLLEEVCQRQ